MNPQPLSAFLNEVKAVINTSFSQGRWVTAEVLSLTGSSHRYLELVEYDESRKELAKAKGVIWRSSAQMLDAFQKASGQHLESGMKVLVKVVPKLHESYGFSVVIEAIDAGYSIGQMQLRIKAIRDYLCARGVVGMNRQLPAPEDFFRVAVIAPREAAGLGDFRTESDQMAALGLCTFDYYFAQFQGEGAADQIVEAMGEAVRAHRQGPAYDALVIIRGGGDSAGLLQLNHQRLCHAVCRCPLPVIIGIGHERDKLLLDELANTRLATPSMVITHIKQSMIANATAALDAFEKLDKVATQAFTSASEQAQKLADALLEKADRQAVEVENRDHRSFDQILVSADRHLDRAIQAACSLSQELLHDAETLVDRSEAQAKQHLTQVMAANPLAILSQGYGYVRDATGGYVTHASQAKAGETIKITLQDGMIAALVSTTEEKNSDV